MKGRRFDDEEIQANVTLSLLFHSQKISQRIKWSVFISLLCTFITFSY